MNEKKLNTKNNICNRAVSFWSFNAESKLVCDTESKDFFWPML